MDKVLYYRVVGITAILYVIFMCGWGINWALSQTVDGPTCPLEEPVEPCEGK